MEFKKHLEKTEEYGLVEEVNPPLILSSGLPGAKPNEIVVFESGEVGQVLSLQDDAVEVMTFSQSQIRTGTRVTRTGEHLSVPVGDEFLGNVVDPLGELIFKNKKFSKPKEEREVDVQPLKIKNRAKIERQLVTGMTTVDILLPIGMGQRELMVGDRKTGKTAAITTIVQNLLKTDVIVVYALIGKKQEEIKRIKEYFEENNLTKTSVVVATSSKDSPSLIDLTPYSAMTMAEYFRDNGKDVLVVFDDLTTHAKFYREISLIGKRFPGRESFPGDIFYKHAKLLERGGNFTVYKDKESSITCLPVAETIQGNLTDYIVSNLISITDGHILFDQENFNKGIRPAVNIFLSVTRVGKQTQDKVARDLNQRILSFLIKYDKAQEFSHFGAELSSEVKSTIDKGDKLYEFFKQSYKNVIPLTVQKLGMTMVWQGLFKDVNQTEVAEKRNELVEKYMENKEDKKFLDSVVDVESIDELIKKIKSDKDKLMEIWDIELSEEALDGDKKDTTKESETTIGTAFEEGKGNDTDGTNEDESNKTEGQKDGGAEGQGKEDGGSETDGESRKDTGGTDDE